MKKEKVVGNIDHIVIAVKNMQEAKSFFSELLDTEFIQVGVNEELGIRNVISPGGVELIEPIRPDSNIAKFIDKRGEGLFALAFTVSDIDRARAKAEKTGIRVVGSLSLETGPLKGLRQIWLHPKDSFGVQVIFTQGNPYHP